MRLSKADSSILAQVFDPESSPNKVEILVSADLPADRHIHDSALLYQLKNREKEAIAFIEDWEKAKSSNRSKDDAFQSALAVLDKMVAEQPKYASVRNNRAQLRRWRFGDRTLLSQPKDESRKSAGMATVQDLKVSISLASPDRPREAVSPSQGRLLAQSYTQLGAIYYAASKDMSETGNVEAVEMDGLPRTAEHFEEEASRLFRLGGMYGNEVAKALAVHTNPHAKLCGSIVKEAMRKELAGMQA